MRTYSGTCYGGPHNGEKFAHQHTRYSLYRMDIPAIGSEPDAELRPLEPAKIGEYRWIPGMWVWRAEGKQ